MTNPRAAAVEAAAMAICEDQERSGGPPWDMWPEMERSGRIAKETFRNQARDAIAAYEAHMAEAGWVMVPVKPTREMVDAAAQAPALKLAAMAFYDAMIRAAMLGRDDPPRADGEG